MQSGEPVNSTSTAGDPFQPGDRVRVRDSVVVFHHPQHRGAAFDLKGQEGEVHTVLNDWKGRVISPNLPVIVAFGKFRAHFRDNELERA
jgi:hypothetical protein